MAMGTRKDQEQQEELWTPQASLAKGASHPFYQRLNQLLEESRSVTDVCKSTETGSREAACEFGGTPLGSARNR